MTNRWIQVTVVIVSVSLLAASGPTAPWPLFHSQVTKLIASDAVDDDRFGVSAAISGDTVVVGAYRQDGAGSEHGAAHIFNLQPYVTDNSPEHSQGANQ